MVSGLPPALQVCLIIINKALGLIEHFAQLSKNRSRET